MCRYGSCTQDRIAGTIECYIVLRVMEFEVSNNIRNIPCWKKKSTFVRNFKINSSARKKPLHEITNSPYRYFIFLTFSKNAEMKGLVYFIFYLFIFFRTDIF